MMDFTIADAFGIDAVKDTYKQVIKEYQDNVTYMGELTIVLNHKLWILYKEHPHLGQVYEELWRDVQRRCFKRFKGDDLTKYYNIID